VARMLFFQLVESTDPRADDGAAAERVLAGKVDAAVLDCLSRGGHGELREAIEAVAEPRLNQLLRMPLLDFATEMNFERGMVELLNGRDTTLPGEQSTPVVRDVVRQRVDRPHPRDHNTAGHFFWISRSM